MVLLSQESAVISMQYSQHKLPHKRPKKINATFIEVEPLETAMGSKKNSIRNKMDPL